MAASGGNIGFGTTITIGGSDMGQITNVDVGDFTRDDVEISNAGSEESWKEFIPGMKDGGTIAIEAVYLKAQATTVLGKFDTDVAEAVVVTFPDGSHFDCNAYVNSMGVSAPFDDKISLKYQLKITGKPEFTAGT